MSRRLAEDFYIWGIFFKCLQQSSIIILLKSGDASLLPLCLICNSGRGNSESKLYCSYYDFFLKENLLSDTIDRSDAHYRHFLLTFFFFFNKSFILCIVTC